MNVKDIAKPQTKNKYQKSIEKFANNLEEKIEFLEKKKDEVDSNIQSLYQEKIDYLQQKQDQLKEKIRSVKNTNEEKWKRTSTAIDVELKRISIEAETAYKGVKNGFSYLFDKWTRDN